MCGDGPGGSRGTANAAVVGADERDEQTRATRSRHGGGARTQEGPGERGAGILARATCSSRMASNGDASGVGFGEGEGLSSAIPKPRQARFRSRIRRGDSDPAWKPSVSIAFPLPAILWSAMRAGGPHGARCSVHGSV